jgi:hypothetical protein
MDGQFQGMMSHVDGRFDHMQSHFDDNSLLYTIDFMLLTPSWMGFIHSLLIFALIFKILCMIPL